MSKPKPKKLCFPPAVLEQHIAMVGKTGSGKTSTSKLAIEQVVAGGARVCILDPIKSDWWGLTSSSDGKKAGLPFYILGGPHGHVPLHATAGKAIGEIVANGKLPLSIIDMADFDMGEPQKFFVDFAHALFRHMTGIVYLVIEEAHEFAPKESLAGKKGNESVATYWMKKLATAARSKGVRMIVCTQRTQALHNAVLGSCDSVVAHRLTLPADQKPVIDWLKANTDKETVEKVSSSLSSLKPGEAWICSGEAKIVERVQFPRIHTYDNSATPTNKKTSIKVRTAAVDQTRLASIIGDAVAEAKANDPAELKKKVDELEKRLKAQPANHPDAQHTIQELRTKVKFLEQAAKLHEQEVKKAVDAATSQVAASGKQARDQLAKCEKVSREIIKLLGTLNFELPAIDKSQVLAAARKPIAPAVIKRAEQQHFRNVSGTGAAGTAELGRMERALMTTIAQHPEGLNKGQILVLAGYRQSGDTSKAFARFVASGWIQGEAALTMTDEGFAALGEFEPLPTGDDLREKILAESNTMHRNLLQVIFDAHPHAMRKGEILEKAGYKQSGDTSKAFAKWTKINWIVNTPEGVRANDNLFA